MKCAGRLNMKMIIDGKEVEVNDKDFFPHSDKMKEAIRKCYERETKKAKAEHTALVEEAIIDELKEQEGLHNARMLD